MKMRMMKTEKKYMYVVHITKKMPFVFAYMVSIHPSIWSIYLLLFYSSPSFCLKSIFIVVFFSSKPIPTSWIASPLGRIIPLLQYDATHTHICREIDPLVLAFSTIHFITMQSVHTLSVHRTHNWVRQLVHCFSFGVFFSPLRYTSFWKKELEQRNQQTNADREIPSVYTAIYENKCIKNRIWNYFHFTHTHIERHTHTHIVSHFVLNAICIVAVQP